MVTRSMGMGGGTPIRPDGKFTISGVAPGEYILRVNVPGGNEAATAAVTVGDSDITEVQLMMQKPTTIRGRVVVDDSAPAPKASTLNVFARSDIPMMGGANARVKDDFTFEMSAPAGHLHLSMFNGE